MDTKVYLMGLIISCPLMEAEESCPVAKYRKTHITSLIELTNRIPIEELVKITKYHKMCLKNRVTCTKVG